MPDYADETRVARHAGGAKRLIEIADTTGDGSLDTGLVDAAIDEAEALVNSYARKQYAVPMNPVPPSIAEVSAAIAVYNLKAYRDALTEADVTRQEDRIQWLENLARGRIDPGIEPAPAKSGHVASSATARPGSKAVPRDNLKGYT